MADLGFRPPGQIGSSTEVESPVSVQQVRSPMSLNTRHGQYPHQPNFFKRNGRIWLAPHRAELAHHPNYSGRELARTEGGSEPA